MGDPESPVQESPEFVRNSLRLSVGRDLDLKRHDRLLLSEAPNMEVGDLQYFGLFEQRPPELTRVQIARGSLKEDPSRVPNQPERDAKQQQANQKREDGIRYRLPGKDDDQAGYDGGQGGQKIPDDMKDGASDVQVVTIPACEDGQGDQIDQKPSNRHPEHDRSLNGDRRQDAVDGVPEDGPDHEEHPQPVCESDQDLGPVEAEGVLRRRGSPAQPKREPGEEERDAVAEHVAGIGQERQRAR